MPDKPFFVDFHPSRWISGVAELSAEARGAYIHILALYWDKRGRVRDDDSWLARQCNMSVRRFRTIKKELIEAGKITVVDGRISNERAESTLSDVNERVLKRSSRGKSNADKRWLNDDSNADKREIIEQETAENSQSVDARGNAIQTKTQNTFTDVNEADAKDVLWSRGIEAVQDLTGWSREQSIRSFVGKMLKQSGNDAMKVLKAIDATLAYREESGGIGDAAAYMLKCAEDVSKPWVFDETSLEDWRRFLGGVYSDFRRDYLRGHWLIADQPMAKLGPNPWQKPNKIIPAEICAEYAGWGWL